MQKHTQQTVTYICLMTLFVSLVYKLSLRIDLATLPTWGQATAAVAGLVFFPFAANRFGRVVAFEPVGHPLRMLFTKVVPHSSGAGDTVEPKADAGPLLALGQLTSCPICSGQWSAEALIAVSLLVRLEFGLLLVLVAGAAGIAELINYRIEVATWTSHKTREETGYWNRYNKETDVRNTVYRDVWTVGNPYHNGHK